MTSKTMPTSGDKLVLTEPIVFFGSGPVAAKSLELLSKHFTIEAVITKPKPVHHKEPFPVLQCAERLHFSTFTPTNKHELSEVFASKPFHSKLGIVIDYGIIIARDVIDYFPFGIVNSHFSLLPKWRGADPITFSILEGDRQTGVSLMLITETLDEGDLLAQAPYDLPTDITAPRLTDDLIELSDATLQHVLPLYVRGDIQPAPQAAVTMAPDTAPSYSRKLTKEDGLLDWAKSAEQLEREIRAFIEWPRSRTELAGKPVIVTKASVVNEQMTPGQVVIENQELYIGCGDKALKIERLKPAGKTEMDARAFLQGYRVR